MQVGVTPISIMEQHTQLSKTGLYITRTKTKTMTIITVSHIPPSKPKKARPNNIIIGFGIGLIIPIIYQCITAKSIVPATTQHFIIYLLLAAIAAYSLSFLIFNFFKYD
jgi:hypothetical protein